jgi:hypothetical protein
MSALRFRDAGHAIDCGRSDGEVDIQELILVILAVGAGERWLSSVSLILSRNFRQEFGKCVVCE